MEEWIDKEVIAEIETEFDELTGAFRPIIVIGDKKFTWDEFGDEVQTYEGWKFIFKLSQLYMPPEADYD